MTSTSQPLWHVLHVRPRCEKKAAAHCARLGLTVYLPLRERTCIYQRRKVTVEKPVFPGYVFAVFAPRNRVAVLRSRHVARILEVKDQARLEAELSQIRLALAIDRTLAAGDAYTTGQRVRIAGGPFRGLEGVVQTVRGGTRVLLNVEIIGQAVAVDAEKELLEPVQA